MRQKGRAYINQRRLIDSIAFTIVQAIDMFDGEYGRYWMTYAIAQDGEFKGRRVMLPKAAASIADGDYLARCDNDTGTIIPPSKVGHQ